MMNPESTFNGKHIKAEYSAEKGEWQPNTNAFIDWPAQFGKAKNIFILKHKDIDVVEFDLDESGLISSFGTVFNELHLPVGTADVNGIDAAAMSDWWRRRSIPEDRDGLREFMESLGIVFPQELLKRSFGLSLSDQYWICPQGEDHSWAEIDFFHNTFSEDIGDLLFGKKDSRGVDAIDLISPDNTSDGVLKKRWKIINGKRFLIKSGSRPFNQEVSNEVLASRICMRLGIPVVNYEITEMDGERYSVCEDFITGDTELVTARYVRAPKKKNNRVSDYESFIAKAEELGIPDVRRRTDMMLTLDFIIANTDRHYGNFGLIRNADTLKWLSVAPIFDSGTSMWCKEMPGEIDISNVESKPFRNRHEKQIKLIRDFSWLDLDLLDGIEKEYAEILSGSVADPSELAARNERLCSALRERIELLRTKVDQKQK